MSTLAQMRSRIADDINRTDLNSQIDKAINRAIEYYEKERFWFQETTGTFTTIANQQAYGTADGLPSDIKEIDVVKLTIASTNVPKLDRESYEYIAMIDVGAFSSQPSCFAWYQSKLYLYPRPNGVWTVTLSYKKSYTALSSDSDTNDWTSKAEDLIEARATWWIYKRIIKSKADADDAKAEEMEVLSAMRIKANQLLGTNKIRQTYF